MSDAPMSDMQRAAVTRAVRIRLKDVRRAGDWEQFQRASDIVAKAIEDLQKVLR